MRTIWIGMVASRLANVCEAGLFLYFLGGDHVVTGAFLSLAGYQVSGWVFSFVPMQAGSAEGSAYVLFGAVGLSPQLGVMVEIGRKLRKVVFIGLGVSVLGWDTFRRMMSGEHRKTRADSPDAGESKDDQDREA